MSWTNAPALRAIIADANNVAPGRSTASDGTVGDAAHAASTSDHNPDPVTGIVHAVDITHDPAHGMDTWHWAQIIADRIKAGAETRVKYLVAYDPAKGYDVIFNPSVSMTWRQNGIAKAEHTNHLHTSILHTPSAENDVRPYFVAGTPAPTPGDDDLTPEQAQQLADVHSFISEIKAPVHNPGDPVHVGILQKLSDLHAFMSEIKAKVAAAFGKLGV